MQKNIVIGINWEQNSSACLMINGEIIGACSEERFSRIKNDERYPKKSIDWLLKKFSIKKKEISAVCFISKIWAPGYILTRHYTTFSMDDYIYEQKNIWYPRIYEKKSISQIKVFKDKLDLNQFPGKKFWNKIVKKFEKTTDHVSNKDNIIIGQKIRSDVAGIHLKISKEKIHFIDHSFGHACYAYFASRKKYSKSLVTTMDAFGDNVNYSAYRVLKRGEKIQFKKIVSGGDFIIGRLYRYVTLILGLKPNEHEYKVMGLAPYTKRIYCEQILKIFRKIQIVKGIKFKYLNKPKDSYFAIKKFLDGRRFDSIAGALQIYTEELISKWYSNIISKSKIRNVYLAGGVAMNVKANLENKKSNKINTFFIPPSPDDTSQSIGACYAFYYSKFKKSPKPLLNAYLGPEAKIKKLNEKKVSKKKYLIIKKNINFQAAKLLTKGKVIARCVGRAEFGARSLGNRSILANPSYSEIKKKINESVKNRDFWMPFAASTTQNYAKKYFIKNKKFDEENYNYMTNCLDSTKLGKQKIPAALHPYDYTCRPQILSKNQNKSYEELIKLFAKTSKIYAILNTSLNFHGKPIINDENEAYQVLEKTQLDGLILEDMLLIKK